jgi:hypothetical protein
MPTITGRRVTAPARSITTTATVGTRAGANITVAVPPRTVAPSPCCCPACTSLQCLDRTRFFAGQLLTEADLNNEQSYWLAKNRLHNKFLHGWGVVCGLQVVCSDCEGWVTVKTGYAIDPCGNDIIVCQEQPFNILKAIQACCTPQKQSNCAPLRYTPPTTCQDLIQTWCITIEYQEQESRMVTSLQPPAKSCGCGCGGSPSKGGCGCGCGGGGAKNGHSTGSGKSSCGCSTQTAVATATPAGACEPTRIIEGFKLGVICEPQPSTTVNETPAPPKPGTFSYQFELCYQTLHNLLLQKPDFTTNPPPTPANAYQAACNYLTAVRNAVSASYLTHCQIESKIGQITISPPPLQDPGNYVSGLQGSVDMIAFALRATALDCLCTSLLPPCPPDPCDDRLILACVTVQGGKIINICHFDGRKQLVTFQSLYYWLSIFKFDVILADLGKLLELICCGEEFSRQGLFNSNVSYRENITSAGFTNPAMLNNAMMSFVAQKFGATLLNSASPNANIVDLRAFVGLDTATALRSLTAQHNIPANNITQMSVDSNPAWTDTAVASAAQYAPAAFNPADQLTVYTKGKQIVGFDSTSPTDILKLQVQQLQQQVNQLTNPTASSSKPGDETARHPKKKH